MKEIQIFEAHTSYVLGTTFTPDNSCLISSGMDNVIKLWSVPGWELLQTLTGHSHSVNSISLSSDGRLLASGSSDNTVRLWSIPDGNALQVLQDRNKVVSNVKISKDGNWVTAGSYGGRAAVWKKSGELLAGFKASDKNLASIAISPDNATLATGGLGDDINIWSLPDCQHKHKLDGHKTAVFSLMYINAGRTLVSLGYEGRIKFWNTSSWQLERELKHESKPRGFSFSPDERIIALSLESEVQLWSVDDLKLRNNLPVSTKVINGMSFSRDGKWFVLGAADRKIRVWKL